jgi:hypothetical protein
MRNHYKSNHRNTILHKPLTLTMKKRVRIFLSWCSSETWLLHGTETVGLVLIVKYDGIASICRKTLVSMLA